MTRAGNFSGRVAVVTGGASGIGEACARLFAARGATVVIADRNSERATAVAGNIGGMAAEVDVVDGDALDALAARVARELGPASIVVTSAGISQRPLPPEEFGQDQWELVTDVNLKGTYLTCRTFGTQMANRGAGSIVTIASVAGMRSLPLHAYAPGKAAVIHLTAGLAAEWGRSGVRVNCISPGFTQTPALRRMFERGQRDPTLALESTALGRLVEPDEIARAAAFLVSDEARSITGINLPVDAGWLTTGSWNVFGGVRPPRMDVRKPGDAQNRSA